MACLAQLAGFLELLDSWLHPEAVQLLLMSWLNIQAGIMSIQVSVHALLCAAICCNYCVPIGGDKHSTAVLRNSNAHVHTLDSSVNQPG